MSWLDILPSHERTRIRAKRKRSPEVYAETRENVHGPEEIEHDMERNEALAEMKFALNEEPLIAEALKKSIQEDMQNHPNEFFEDGAMDTEAFSIDIDEDGITVSPEGNISDKLRVSTQFSEKYIAQFSAG